MEFTEEELEYYSRQITLQEIGYNGQLKLKTAKVCIVGLGGLGSPIAFQLASMGIGFIRLVDYDIVELSNLQRQHLYDINHLGYSKVEVAKKKLCELNPNITIEPLPLALNSSNVEEIIDDVDVVVDGLDQMSTRFILNRACQKKGIPYIFGGAIMSHGNTSTFIPKKTPCLECFVGEIKDDSSPTCATVGIYPSVLGVIASIQVSETIRILLEKPPLLANKLFLCDISSLLFEEIDIRKSETCSVCGSKPETTPTPIEHQLINEVCGRDGKRVFIITPESNLNLQMKNLSLKLTKSKFNILVNGLLGITFTIDSKKTVSILKSGVMILKGFKTEKTAYGFYQEILGNNKQESHNASIHKVTDT